MAESETPEGNRSEPISKATLTALGGTLVTGTFPLVFPAIPIEAGIALWTAAGGMFLYAGRDWIRERLPARWRKRRPAEPGMLDTWSVQDDAALQERKREEEERAYSDEWAFRARKYEGGNPVRRDKALGQALAYHVEGNWGVEFFDSVKAGHNPGAHLERAIQLAYDGELTVWGKRSEAGVYEIIPKDYWADHHVDLFSLMRRNAKTVSNSRAASETLYFGLMISRAQFEQAMPCDVEAIKARAGAKGEMTARASAEPSLYELWKALDPLHLYQAACLWVGVSPPNDEEAQLPPQATPMLQRLKNGIIDGDLPYFNDPDGTKAGLTAVQKVLSQYGTKPLKIASDVQVSREGLRTFAETIGERPAFLFGDEL